MEEKQSTDPEILPLESFQERDFNLAGVLDPRDHEGLTTERESISKRYPWVRSLVLLGTGGSAFWRSLDAATRRRKNPIDCATVRKLKNVQGLYLKEHYWIFPFRPSGMTFNFRKIGEEVGFGIRDTVLGILIHPQFGPWVSLRAILLTDIPFLSTPRLNNFDPCAPCSKPCISACPALAMRRTGVEFRSCGNHLIKSSSCEEGCLSRLACVLGQEEVYSLDENKHRQSFANRSLRAWARKPS